MVKKTVVVDVQSTGLDDLNTDINKVEGSLQGVKTEAGNASSGLEKVGENGGAIAVLDSLTGGLASKLRDAAEATKLFNFSLKSLKTALIATGIGAFVVAVGLVVVYWEDIKELVAGTTENIEAQNAALETNISIIDEKLKRIDIEKRVNEGNEEVLKRIALKEKGLLRDKLDSIKVQIIKAKASLAEEESLASQATWWGIILGFSEEQRKKSDEEKARIKEKKLALEELLTLEQELLNPTETKKKEPTTPKVKQEREEAVAVSTLDVETTEQKNAREIGERVAHLATVAEKEEEARQGQRDANASYAEYEKEEADKKIALEQTVADAKAAIQDAQLNNIGAGFALLGKIAGKNKALQAASIVGEAAVGIAKQIIATRAANAGALATPQAILTSGVSAIPVIAANNIGLGIGIASTVAATAKAVKALGGGGGGGGGLSSAGAGGASSVPAPVSRPAQFNVVGTSGTNQLAQSLGNQPIKTYVVSTDMSSQQEFDRSIEESASF